MRTIRHWKAVQTAILLALLVFQTVGWLALWQLARQEARYHAEEVMRIQREHLVERILSTSNYRKSRAGKRELRLDGHMFDIASEEHRGDSVRLLLYRDIREEQLYSKMSQLLAPAFDAGPQSASGPPTLYILLAKWLQSAVLPPDPTGLTCLATNESSVDLPEPGFPGDQLLLARPDPPPKEQS